MLPPQIILRPGSLITGERLRQLFKYRDPLPMPTGPVPSWSRLNTVHSQSGQSIAHVGRQIIPRVQPPTFMRVLSSSVMIPERRWLYNLDPVRPTINGTSYESTGAPSVQAFNVVELNNTAGSTIVGYGVDVADTLEASITLLPIEVNSIVEPSKLRDDQGQVVYWFSADNPIMVECTGA